jgi:hypothetical protein
VLSRVGDTLNAKQCKTTQKKPIFAFLLPLNLSIFAIAPESQPVSDERADKTAAHKGN